MRLWIDTYEHINIAVWAEVIPQNGPKYCEFSNAPAFAEFGDFVAWKDELLSGHGLNYSMLEINDHCSLRRPRRRIYQKPPRTAA
jgi:hypothetical protein